MSQRLTPPQGWLLAALLFLVPLPASAGLFLTIGAEGDGLSKNVSGGAPSGAIHGWSTNSAGLIGPGDLPCNVNPACTFFLAYTPSFAAGAIDDTGHVRTYASAGSRPSAGYVRAGLTDSLTSLGGFVTFEIEIDLSLLAANGVAGADYLFELFLEGEGEGSGDAGFNLFSFEAHRHADDVGGLSGAYWAASTVNNGDPQVGAPPFFTASVTVPQPVWGVPLNIGLNVEGSAVCQAGVECVAVMRSINSGCLRVLGATSASGYSFNCDLDASETGGTGSVPEPGATALYLMAGVLAMRRVGRRHGGIRTTALQR